MHLKIKKKLLEKSLNKISKALAGNPTLMSLKGIKTIVTKDIITFITSDGLLSIKETIKVNEEIKVLTPGEILIPGKTFIEIIKKQSDELEIQVINNVMKITSKNYSININLIEVESYPNIDFDIIGEELIIDANKFREAIKGISFAAAENDKRIILNGINLIAKNNKLRISATDSFRLATTKIDIPSNNDFNITIMAKNLKDFVPTSINGEVKIKVDENKINLKHESRLIQSRLIDGIYPELSRLIPKEYNYNLKIDTKVLNDLIDKAIVIYSGDIKTVKLTIKNNELFIESKSEEVGNTKISTKEFNWSNNKEFEIAFDSRFMKDALRQFSGEVNIRFISEFKPFIITSNSKQNLVQLVLPHRGY